MQSVDDSLSEDDSYFAEGYALAATRIALVMDRPLLANLALERVADWKGQAAIKMRDVLLAISKVSATRVSKIEEAAMHELVALFDIYRVPYPNKELTDLKGSVAIVRFELAVLVEKFRQGNEGPLSLKNVYVSVTA